MHYLYTDGGSRGNPGASAVGYFLFDDQMHLIDFGGKYIGSGTNNKAEYFALKRGLELAKKHNVQNITCLLDSELVVNQLNKVYKVSSTELKPFFTSVVAEKKHFAAVNFKHVPRKENHFADRMVNIILDSTEK